MSFYNLNAKLNFKLGYNKLELTKDLFNLAKKGLQLDENNLVLLSLVNSKIIEESIKNDYDYIPFSHMIFKSIGKDLLLQNDKDSWIALIREIDRDNSTNVWRYRDKNKPIEENGILKIVNFITNINNDFLNRLEMGDILLVDEMVTVCGSAVTSLASKVCKYLSEFLFEKDNYYINDKYIRKALPFYLEKYNIYFSKKQREFYYLNISYEKLHFYLDEIKSRLLDNLTRSNIDHIIWYSYKSYNS